MIKKIMIANDKAEQPTTTKGKLLYGSESARESTITICVVNYHLLAVMPLK